MIKSMTAYGRSKITSPLGEWSLEIHSVNRKILDINVHLPKELLRYDLDVRKWLSEHLARGQITIRLHIQQDFTAPHFEKGHLAHLKNLKNSWEKIAQELGYAKETIDLNFLTRQLQQSSSQDLYEDDALVKDLLKHLVHEALEELLRMKEKEAMILAQDIEMRLKMIQESIAKISKRSSDASLKYRAKLEERIKEACGASAEIDERILREIIIYAEKQDITEEMTRLHSHFLQFGNLLASTEKSVGRTLDFLTQEINREVNTMASKSSDSEISGHIVLIKSELEKIREQIQNIE